MAIILPILKSGNILLKRGPACLLTAMGMLCSIRNDVKNVSALIVANSVSFEKKVSILVLEHAFPAACTCHVDSMCFQQSYNPLCPMLISAWHVSQ